MIKEFYDIGAEIVENAKVVYERADMIMKVKEPLREEYSLLKEGQILFTYLHLAALKSLLKLFYVKKLLELLMRLFS
jgi:alanine dehydrogenase